MTEFKLPELGENIEAGDVVRLLVSAGDVVEKDQPVLELETDKATIEVPSAVSGTVREVRVEQGDKVKVGQVIFTVEDGAAKEGGKPAAKEDDESARPRPQPAGTVEEGGPSQNAPDQPARAARKKAAAPADEAPDEGPAEGEEEEEEEEEAEAEHEEARQDTAPRKERGARRGEVVDISRGARPAPSAETPSPAALVPAAPSVRRLARELGVDITQVSGSGPGGRIVAEDVKAYVKAVVSSAGRAAAGTPSGGAPTVPLPDFSKWGEIDPQPMKSVRRKTAEHLSRAWATIPHVTQHDRADITALEELRARYARRAEKAGGKMTPTAIALKVAAAALRQFPQFNASIDVASEEIIFKKYVHIGVAVDTDRGLLVPVIRDVDRKGIIELSVELAQLSAKARARKLTLEEMEGGTFTITNLGGIGGTSFTPIVNAPEAAILGLSRATMEPVFRSGTFEPRLLLPLSLSYDHRVIDGADAARFLRWVAEALEQPFVLSL
jgi:pyruvate dehydrogenase E2 component (dihydrolipoamide acetyltransferase)